MIDERDDFWYGDSPGDIVGYLKAYSGNEKIDVKEIICRECAGARLFLNIDSDEGVVQVICAECGHSGYLLDSVEYLEDAELEEGVCPVCGDKIYNIGIGFTRRKNGDVRDVYIGARCTGCGVLGCYGEWGVNYSPTAEMEKNI